MVGWFGKSWGAPACEEEEHLPTPVGEPCARCVEPILVGHQGVIMGAYSEEKGPHAVAYHLDCYLRGLLPHGADCPRCRGVDRLDHDAGCAYRSRGERCDCLPPPMGPGDTPSS